MNIELPMSSCCWLIAATDAPAQQLMHSAALGLGVGVLLWVLWRALQPTEKPRDYASSIEQAPVGARFAQTHAQVPHDSESSCNAPSTDFTMGTAEAKPRGKSVQMPGTDDALPEDVRAVYEQIEDPELRRALALAHSLTAIANDGTAEPRSENVEPEDSATTEHRVNGS